jgi:hypothetical protein
MSYQNTFSNKNNIYPKNTLTNGTLNSKTYGLMWIKMVWQVKHVAIWKI